MKNKTTNKKHDKGHLIEDEAFTFHRSNGNGTIRRQVWKDKHGRVTRYNLAYINYRLFRGDNGRVLGYDNAHGYHHRHYMGKIDRIHLSNFGDIEHMFQQEFEVLHEQAKNEK